MNFEIFVVYLAYRAQCDSQQQKSANTLSSVVLEMDKSKETEVKEMTESSINREAVPVTEQEALHLESRLVHQVSN